MPTRTTRPVALACAAFLVLTTVVGVPPATAAPTPSPAAQPAAQAAPAASTFVDVTPGTAFHAEISWLAERGISTGWVTPRGREFRPVTPVARDAMAAFIYRLQGSPDFTPPAVSPFSDVDPTNQFYKEITWFEAQSITTGWRTASGAREFRPLEPVSREAMAAFFHRLSGAPDFTAPGTSPFVDVPTANPFYKEITWLEHSRITTGWELPDGTREYRPAASINRDAMAAFMHRYAHLNADVVIRDRSFAATKDQCAAIRSYDPATGTLVNDASEPFFATLQVDDAITTHPCAAAPESFLRRVTGVREDGGTRTFDTVPITLGEIIVSTGGLLEPTPEVVEETIEPLNGAVVTQAPPPPGVGPTATPPAREITVQWDASVSTGTTGTGSPSGTDATPSSPAGSGWNASPPPSRPTWSPRAWGSGRSPTG